MKIIIFLISSLVRQNVKYIAEIPLKTGGVKMIWPDLSFGKKSKMKNQQFAEAQIAFVLR